MTVERAFRAANITNETVVLGVSGGPDSQALLKCVGHIGNRLGITAVAVGINHGLRPAADGELDIACELAESVGIRFVRRRVTVTRDVASLQASARDARYSALFSVADEISARHVVTAHHWDDRAETVLFRLLRGRGLGSLGVMPPVSGRIFRPMLGLTHEELLGYCRRWNLKYAIDPSNEDEHYTRVAIRKRILPILEELSPRLRERLNELSDEVLHLPRAE